MNLLGKIRSKFMNETSTDTNTETIGTNPTLEQLESFFNTQLENISSTKLTSSTYYSCMLIRCNAIAKMPLKLMKSDEEKGDIEVKDHPLYKLLKLRPNEFISAHDFLWATEFQRLEYGNAFWVFDINRGTVSGLYLLDSTRVTIYVDEGHILSDKHSVYYVYQDIKNGELIYTNDEIVHFKNFAMNGVKGTSIKKYMADIIQNEQYANKVLKGKYKNGLQDPIVVKYIGDLNDAMQQKIKKKFADLGGAKNAGKVVPIPSEFDVTQLETKLVNSQFFQLQGLNTRQIANTFGVKGFQLNDMEKSTYNNIEQQNKAFYSDTMQNVFTIYEQEIQYKLLTSYERDSGYYFKFNVDTMLRSDVKTRYEAYSSAINDGWKTRAEIRKLEGLPHKEGTDILTVGNGASIPLSMLGKQYAEGGEKNA